ncbi:hypothetical protein Sros01_56450 [Streptomyces roseochromogenus]|nr:hypothetical protein Sros01_56450 [Streptomyces roseochromogenus]
MDGRSEAPAARVGAAAAPAAVREVFALCAPPRSRGGAHALPPGTDGGGGPHVRSALTATVRSGEHAECPIRGGLRIRTLSRPCGYCLDQTCRTVERSRRLRFKATPRIEMPLGNRYGLNQFRRSARSTQPRHGVTTRPCRPPPACAEGRPALSRRRGRACPRRPSPPASDGAATPAAAPIRRPDSLSGGTA